MSERKTLLTFNAGSSTVKIGVFELSASAASMAGKASIDLRSNRLAFELVDGQKHTRIDMNSAVTDDLHEVIDETFAILSEHFEFDDVIAAGHRVVHGGERFTAPVLLDGATVEEIEALTPLAPLHQPEGHVANFHRGRGYPLNGAIFMFC